MADYPLNSHNFQWSGGKANETIITAHIPQCSTMTAAGLNLHREFIAVISKAQPKVTRVNKKRKKLGKGGHEMKGGYIRNRGRQNNGQSFTLINDSVEDLFYCMCST